MDNFNGSSEKVTVIVEGNIGSGKSTLLKYFADRKDVRVVFESTDEWRNVGGTNLLKSFYDNPSEWSFALQSYVLLTASRNYASAISSDARVAILERSVYSSTFCFGETLVEDGHLNRAERAILRAWFDRVAAECESRSKIDLVAYLRVDPETCAERVLLRSRSEESGGGVSIDYLRRLHDKHERWLIGGDFPSPAPVLVLNGAEASPEELGRTLNDRIEEVLF